MQMPRPQESIDDFKCTKNKAVWEPTIVDGIPNSEEKEGIDVSQLSVGMEVKNYSTLCGLLREKILYGNSKVKQINNWHRYFEWDQRGHRYIITKIYKMPLPKIVSDKATYAKFMQLILMRVLLNCGSGTYYFNSNMFYEMSGMVDKEYLELMAICNEGLDISQVDELSKYKYVSQEDMEDFIYITKKRLAEITSSALGSLSATSLISYTKECAVKMTPWNIKGGFRTATNEEVLLILEAEQKALNEMGLTNKYVGYTKYKKIFVGKVNSYIHEHNKDIYGSIRRIRIVYHKPSQEYHNRVTNNVLRSLLKDKYIDEKMKDDDFLVTEFAKIALNDLVINSLINNARLVHEKALRGDQSQSDIYRIEARRKSRYVSDFIYMVDNAIKLKTNKRILDYEEDFEDEDSNIRCEISNDELDLIN